MLVLIFAALTDDERLTVEELYKEQHMFFRKLSFKILGSEDRADDVVSTAFIKIMDNIDKISKLDRQQLIAFCVTIVKNASIDVLRRSKRMTSIDYLDHLPDESTQNIEGKCIYDEDIQRLAGLIDRLEPDEQQFIYLRYTEDMGYGELGRLLGISEDAAKKRGQRLVKKLRDLYERGQIA